MNQTTLKYCSGNFCCECGSVKPGYVSANKQAQNASDNATVSTDTDGKWRCKVCGTRNTDSKCSFCGQTKIDNDKIVIPDQTASPQITLFPYPDVQPARGLMCDMPQMTQPDPNDVQPWLCTNCDHTSKGGEYCFNCGMPKIRSDGTDTSNKNNN